jgi:hypothetical protein
MQTRKHVRRPRRTKKSPSWRLREVLMRAGEMRMSGEFSNLLNTRVPLWRMIDFIHK